MAYQRFIVEGILGMDRGRAAGDTPQPSVAHAVEYKEGASVGPRGCLYEVKKMQTGSGRPTNFVDLNLVGYDHGGFATFTAGLVAPNGNANYFITSGQFIDGITVAASIPASEDQAYHIPEVGHIAWGNSTRPGGILYTATAVGDTATLNRAAPFADVTWTAPAVVAGGGSFAAGTYDILMFAYTMTSRGRFVLKTGYAQLTLAANDRFSVGGSLTGGVGLIYLDVYVRKNGDATSFYTLAATVDTGASKTVAAFPIGTQLEGSTPEAEQQHIINGFRGQTRFYRGRLWGMAKTNHQLMHVPASGLNLAKEEIAQRGHEVVLYSTLRYMNVTAPTGFLSGLPLPRVAGTGVEALTGIAVTEEGLLIFSANGSALVYGDPTLASFGRIENFGVRPYAYVGHNGVQPPAMLGSVVLVVWQGRVQAVSGGQAQDITREVYDSADPFRLLAVDPLRKQVVCMTEAGEVLVYDPLVQRWFRDEASDGLYDQSGRTVVKASGTRRGPPKYIVPDAEFGILFLLSDGTNDVINGYARSTADTVTSEAVVNDDLYLQWSKLALGDRWRRDQLVRVRVRIEGWEVGDWDPRLDILEAEGYTASNITAEHEGADDFLFTLEHGVNARVFDVRLRVRDPRDGIRVEAPIEFVYVPYDETEWSEPS